MCLNDNVLLVDRMPVVEMPNLFVHADIMFASLKNEEIFPIQYLLKFNPIWHLKSLYYQ